jgi:hypothetical protein
VKPPESVEPDVYVVPRRMRHRQRLHYSQFSEIGLTADGGSAGERAEALRMLGGRWPLRIPEGFPAIAPFGSGIENSRVGRSTSDGSQPGDPAKASNRDYSEADYP